MWMQRRKLEELSLMDDFLFNAMLTHPETGEKFTNKILKLLFNREFKNLRVSVQKVYAGMNTDLRGARLDVCIEGDCVSIEGDEIPSVYDVEPDQNNKAKDIAAFPRRSRFYHAIIDSRSLKSGEDFGKLKQVYVIFICNYDPFGYDRVLYTIKNRCLEEPEMNYDDGAETIVLYTKGTKGTISEGLRQFLNYMENTDQNNAVNEDLKDIQEMVDVVKRDGEVSLQYMKSFEHDQLMYAQGEAAGREDGLRAGRLAEIKNTEREKKRADMAQSRIKELEAELKKYRKKTTV
jgi:predicted transposase/invertase (TIGR01784 family)